MQGWIIVDVKTLQVLEGADLLGDVGNVVLAEAEVYQVGEVADGARYRSQLVGLDDEALKLAQEAYLVGELFQSVFLQVENSELAQVAYAGRDSSEEVV